MSGPAGRACSAHLRGTSPPVVVVVWRLREQVHQGLRRPDGRVRVGKRHVAPGASPHRAHAQGGGEVGPRAPQHRADRATRALRGRCKAALGPGGHHVVGPVGRVPQAAERVLEAGCQGEAEQGACAGAGAAVDGRICKECAPWGGGPAAGLAGPSAVARAPRRPGICLVHEGAGEAGRGAWRVKDLAEGAVGGIEGNRKTEAHNGARQAQLCSAAATAPLVARLAL